ncbi:DHA2 family efflux MFS transporter permease subunit [Mycetocola tolaasinivorans]|uniref:DHA2 family efflux MFS transporter permease subunit n=1 Tax=Mycetocola tolaasinivorans TaxID=76635 RepID=UPI001FEB12BB|nr:DHA2 family efflux MFS transporter permease subunit [Mycetocola tolaasinivorans]
MSSVTTTPVSDEVATTRRNNRVIALLIAAAFVVILNETIMSVALPALTTDLGITFATAQWLTTGFMLTMAVVIPITGFLLQRFNTRPVFIAAMSLFSLGTLIAAVAPGFAVLLIGRVVQASGTAIMMPLLMTTLMTLVPADKRGRMMGSVSIVISVAPAIGPTLSGLILHYFSWRWMFGLVLPIALIMLIVGIRSIRNVTEPRVVPLDVLSVILSALGFGGLIFGISRISEETTDGGLVLIISLVVGALSLAAFIVRQLFLQRRDQALLDLRTFTSANFTVSILMMVVAMAALFGTIVLLPIYMTSALDMDTVEIGLFMLPGGLVMGLMAPFVGRLFDRFGPRPLLIPGTLIMSATMWFLSTINPNTTVYVLLAAHIVLSFGLALMFTPLFTVAMGSVKPSLYSHASAIVGTVQQVAGAVGTALFITIMSIQVAAQLETGATPALATTAGVSQAFLVGAFIATATVIIGPFIRKPADLPEGAAPMAH